MRLELNQSRPTFPTDSPEFDLLISGAPGDEKQPISSMYISTTINMKAATRLHNRLGALLKKAKAKK